MRSFHIAALLTADNNAFLVILCRRQQLNVLRGLHVTHPTFCPILTKSGFYRRTDMEVTSIKLHENPCGGAALTHGNGWTLRT